MDCSVRFRVSWCSINTSTEWPGTWHCHHLAWKCAHWEFDGLLLEQLFFGVSQNGGYPNSLPFSCGKRGLSKPWNGLYVGFSTKMNRNLWSSGEITPLEKGDNWTGQIPLLDGYIMLNLYIYIYCVYIFIYIYVYWWLYKSPTSSPLIIYTSSLTWNVRPHVFSLLPTPRGSKGEQCLKCFAILGIVVIYYPSVQFLLVICSGNQTQLAGKSLLPS